MVGGLRCGVLLYMYQQKNILLTPGEIAAALQRYKSTVQEILEGFHDHGLTFRFDSPSVSLPPSIASRPPTNEIVDVTRRTVSTPRGMKPYRLNERGERLAQLMNVIEKQLRLPHEDQEYGLTEDKVFMEKLKSFGYDENDIKLAQDSGVIDHRLVKVIRYRHRTRFGYATSASNVDALEPEISVMHRYRIA